MRSSRFALAVAVAVAFAAACSSGTEPTPATSTFDASSYLTEMSSSTSASQNVVASFSTTPTPSLPTPSAASCAYTATSQRFVCPSSTVNGMTIDLSYMLYNASGGIVTVPDPLTVNAIRIIMDMSGTTTPAGTTSLNPITITRHSDQTLSGLLSGNHLINGTASSAMSTTVSGVPISTTEADTTVNLIPPAAGGSAHYPTGGTQTMDLTSGPGVFGVAPVSMRSVISFHADGTATAVTTIGTLTRTCTINLASPGTLPSCS